MSSLPIVQGHLPGLYRCLGYLIDPNPPPPQIVHARAARAAELPDDIWIPTDALVPILDQGPEGACAGHAVAEADYLSALRTDPNAQLGSRQWLYRCGRAIDGTLDRDAGTNYRSVFTEAARVGIPAEVDWPYEPKSGDQDGDGEPTDQFRAEPPAHIVRLAYDRRLPDGELAATSLDTIEGDLSENVDHALSQGIPVCWAGDVGEAFCASDFDPALPVEYPTKRAGAHAMVITGRKIVRASGMAVARWYLIRNSWGTGFANRGRFWMTESYMRTGDLWALNKPPLWRAPVAGGRA